MTIIEMITLSLSAGFLVSWLIFGAIMLQERNNPWFLGLFVIVLGMSIIWALR